jgi:hypothetical protein
VPLTNTLVPGPCPSGGRTDYYLFNVSTNAQRAQFEVLRPDGDVQLVVRRALPLPDLRNADYAGTNSSQNDELIVLFPSSAPVPLAPGDWYLGVINATANPVTYTVQATEFDTTGTNLVTTRFQITSNSLCITWTNTLPGAHYYVLGSVSLTPPVWVPISPPLIATAYELTFCVPLSGQYHFFQLVEGLLVQSPFSMTSLSFSTNGFLIEWSAGPGRTFNVLWTPTLPTAGWNSFTNLVTSTNNLYQFLDDGSQSGGLGGSRFYRLLEQP